MHKGRKSTKVVKFQDSSLRNLDDLKLMSASLTNLNYTDKRLVFLFDRNRQVFDPFLIDAIDERPLINNMKRVPVDISEPVLFTVINTISLSFYEKYKIFRYSDELTNTRESIMKIVKSKELVKFSFYLSPEDLFIAEVLNKGKLYCANWSNRPRVNLEEFINLNAQFYSKFNKNLPNFSLHLANILANGSSLLMVSRSHRSIRSSSSLTKIERMFFWYSQPGDGVYNLFTNYNTRGVPFNLEDDSNVSVSLVTETLHESINNNYYLPLEHREKFMNLYLSIKDLSANEIFLESKPACLDKKRVYLPGKKHIKAKFESILLDVSGHENLYEDFKDSIKFNGQCETNSLSKEGSRQVRRNLFMLYRWLSKLEEASKSLEVDLSTLHYKMRKCKFLIYLNILIFKSGNIEPLSERIV